MCTIPCEVGVSLEIPYENNNEESRTKIVYDQLISYFSRWVSH